MEFGSQHFKASMSKTLARHFFTFQGVDAKCLVAELTPLGVSNRGIQSSNPPSPNYQIKKRKKKKVQGLDSIGNTRRCLLSYKALGKCVACFY